MQASAIRAVTWDVDGTLYDVRAMRRRLAWLAVRGLCSRRALAVWVELRLLARFQAVARQAREAGGDCGGARWPAPAERLREVHERWFGAAIARAGPRLGVLALLEHLRERGLRQVVLSDFHADYKLTALGLEGFFDSVFVGEEIGCLKPGLALFRHVAAALGLEPAAILHVGDRADTDGAAAAAGFQVVVLGREVATPAELLARLRGLDSSR